MDTITFKHSIPKQNKKVDVKIVMLENGALSSGTTCIRSNA